MDCTILFISHSFSNGGAESSLYKIVSYFYKKGYKCVVAGPNEGPYIQFYQKMGVSVIKTKYIGTLFCHAIPLSRMRALLRILAGINVFSYIIWKLKPDLVYTNTATILSGAVAAKLQRVPHIWHIRENFLTSSNDFTNIVISVKLLARLIEFTACKIFVVSFLARKALFNTDRDKCIVIHNCLDTSSFNSYSNANELTCITFIGALDRRKGLDVLLKAFKVLHKKHQNLILELWGEGTVTYVKKLKEWITRNHLQENVLFRGYAANVNKVLENAQLVVMSSRGESFSNVALEAMAAGVPLIVSRCGGPEEFIRHGETGFIFENEDYADLAEKISYCIAFPNYTRNLAKRARKEAQERFDVSVILPRLEEYLLTCLNRLCSKSNSVGALR